MQHASAKGPPRGPSYWGGTLGRPRGRVKVLRRPVSAPAFGLVNPLFSGSRPLLARIHARSGRDAGCGAAPSALVESLLASLGSGLRPRSRPLRRNCSFSRHPCLRCPEDPGRVGELLPVLRMRDFGACWTVSSPQQKPRSDERALANTARSRGSSCNRGRGSRPLRARPKCSKSQSAS